MNDEVNRLVLDLLERIASPNTTKDELTLLKKQLKTVQSVPKT